MEMDVMRRAIQRLRADLIATNKALTALASTLPQAQLEQAIARLAQLSVLNEETVDALPMQPAPETLQLLREAEERVHTLLASAKAKPTAQS